MDYKDLHKEKDKTSINQKKSLFYKSVMQTQQEGHKDDPNSIQMQKMREMGELKRIEAEKNAEKNNQNLIKENQPEMKASELSDADMSKEEKERIHKLSDEADGSLKYKAGSDVDNKLKAMAELNVRQQFKTALTDYVAVRKKVLKENNNAKGKDGNLRLTDKQKAELADAYEVLTEVIKRYLASTEAKAKYGTAANNLKLVNRTTELLSSDVRHFKLTEYKNTQLESRNEKKESDNLPNLIEQMNKEKEQEKKENQEKNKAKDDNKSEDLKEDEMTLEEKKGKYNLEEKTKRDQELEAKNIPVPKDEKELEQIRNRYAKKSEIKNEDGSIKENFEWDEKTDPIMIKNYEWLAKYFKYNKPEIEKKDEKAENKAGEKKVNEKKEWTPIANEVLANDQRDYKFKKTEFPKWNFTSISANKEDLMGKEKLDELIGPDVIAKTAEEYLAKSANSDYVEKYVKNYPQLKELDSLIDETYSKALPGKKISSKAHKEVTKDVKKKLAMQRHLLVENQELLKRRNEERALIQNNLKKEGPRSDYTVDIANNFKTDSEKAALGVWLVGGTYSGDKTRTGKQTIFKSNINDTQFDMECMVEEADLTEFSYNSDSEFIADYAKKYEKLTKLSLVEAFLDKEKYVVKFSKTLLRTKCEMAKLIKAEYEERIKLISSPYYALIPQEDLKIYLGKSGEAKIAKIKDKELADYLTLYRSVNNKNALKKTTKYFDSGIKKAMEIQRDKDVNATKTHISRIKQGQKLAEKLNKNNSDLTRDSEANLKLIYSQQIELAKGEEPDDNNEFVEKTPLKKEVTLFLRSEGKALYDFEKTVAGFLKTKNIYGVPLKKEHEKGLEEELNKWFKARREYVRHKKAYDIVAELSWSSGCDMENEKFVKTKEGQFLKKFANEGSVPIDVQMEVRQYRVNYEQSFMSVFGYLHENGYPMSQDFKYENRIDDEKLVKENLEGFCKGVAKEIGVQKYEFPETTINGRKFTAYSSLPGIKSYEKNEGTENILYFLAKNAKEYTFDDQISEKVIELLGRLEKLNRDMVATEILYGDGALEKMAVHYTLIREKIKQRLVLEAELIPLIKDKVPGIEKLETEAMRDAVRNAEEKKNALNEKEKPEEKNEKKNEEKNKAKKDDDFDDWVVVDSETSKKDTKKDDKQVKNKQEKKEDKAVNKGEKVEEKEKNAQGEKDQFEKLKKELLDVTKVKSTMLRADFEAFQKKSKDKIYNTGKDRYYLRQINMLNYFNKMSDEKAKEMFRAFMIDPKYKLTPEQKTSKARQYEKVFDFLQKFDLKNFDAKSPMDFLKPEKKDALVLAGAIFDFQTFMIDEYKDMIKDKKVKCTYTADQFKVIEEKWDFIHSGMAWINGVYDLVKAADEYKDANIAEALKLSDEEIEGILSNVQNAEKAKFYSSLLTLKDQFKKCDYKGGEFKAADLFKNFRKIRKEEEKKKKAQQELDDKIKTVINKGHAELSTGSLNTMRKNYGAKLGTIAALDKIMGVKVRRTESYRMQLPGIKKLISEAGDAYKNNKKLVNTVLKQFSKLGATEEKLDAKSADKAMLQKGMQACTAYIRYILNNEPVLPEDAVYIRQTFNPKNAVPVSDGNGNVIDANRSINSSLHKEMIKKYRTYSGNPVRLLEEEAKAKKFGNFEKISELKEQYKPKMDNEWKISKTREILPVMMPLLGEKDLSEEEIKKFALDQHIIINQKHAGKEGDDANATAEEQLRAFRDSLPVYKTALEEIEGYKNEFEKIMTDYGKAFSRDNEKVVLYQQISSKAQSICYFADSVLGNNTLMNSMTEADSKEFISLWDSAGAIARMFYSISRHYNAICKMTPNKLITDGYKDWENLKKYKEYLNDIKADHKKRWDRAKNKAEKIVKK